jgi:hypothetical protein
MSYHMLVLQNCTTTSPDVAQRMGGDLSLKISTTPSTTMSVDVLKKLRELVRDGATVVGAKPEKAAGLKDYPRCDEDVKRIAAEVWGNCDGTAITEHRFGKGRVIWGKTPREILAADGVAPDFSYSGQDNPPPAFWIWHAADGYKPLRDIVSYITTLDFIHRRAGEVDIYFVHNRKNRLEALDCAFRVSGKQPEIWDPVSGKIRDAAAFKQTGGSTILPLEFAPYESLFVVFRKPIAADAAGKAERNFPRLSPIQEIKGAWTVRFDTQWGGPKAAEFPELISWTKRPENGIKYYSGKATYRKTFDLVQRDGSPKDSNRIYLDLGNVRHIAEVRLNGKKMGVLWTAPWRLEITGIVRASNNVLEVDVINLWANRVIGDLGLPKEKRLTTTHDAFRFDMITKDTPLLDSGLLGPVTVMNGDR